MKLTFGSSREDIFNASVEELLDAILTTDGSGVKNKKLILYRLLLNKEVLNHLNDPTPKE